MLRRLQKEEKLKSKAGQEVSWIWGRRKAKEKCQRAISDGFGFVGSIEDFQGAVDSKHWPRTLPLLLCVSAHFVSTHFVSTHFVSRHMRSAHIGFSNIVPTKSDIPQRGLLRINLNEGLLPGCQKRFSPDGGEFSGSHTLTQHLAANCCHAAKISFNSSARSYDLFEQQCTQL